MRPVFSQVYVVGGEALEDVKISTALQLGAKDIVTCWTSALAETHSNVTTPTARRDGCNTLRHFVRRQARTWARAMPYFPRRMSPFPVCMSCGGDQGMELPTEDGGFSSPGCQSQQCFSRKQAGVHTFHVRWENLHTHQRHESGVGG